MYYIQVMSLMAHSPLPIGIRCPELRRALPQQGPYGFRATKVPFD